MNSDIPVVTIDYIHYSCSAVCSNNVKCMGDLLDYIISMGHKKIAYIHGEDFSSVTRDRLAAYYRALENHGIDVPGICQGSKVSGNRECCKADRIFTRFT